MINAIQKTASADFKSAMDELCVRYQSETALAADPICIPAKFSDAYDKELSSWVAAHLAYGKVAPMLRAIHRLLSPLGATPAKWARERTDSAIRRDLRKALNGWVWRFHTLEDMIDWVLAWKAVDKTSGNLGLEPALIPKDGQSANKKLSLLINSLRQSLPDTKGLRFNLPDPLKGSAAKRWRLFLRWMARKGWPDFGIWEKYPADALVIPLDTHVHRISRQLGLCARRSQDSKTALEITESLRKLDADDPLKYDFAISHMGILSDCTGKRFDGCGTCPLRSFCVSMGN